MLADVLIEFVKFLIPILIPMTQLLQRSTAKTDSTMSGKVDNNLIAAKQRIRWEKIDTHLYKEAISANIQSMIELVDLQSSNKLILVYLIN